MKRVTVVLRGATNGDPDIASALYAAMLWGRRLVQPVTAGDDAYCHGELLRQLEAIGVTADDAEDITEAMRVAFDAERAWLSERL